MLGIQISGVLADGKTVKSLSRPVSLSSGSEPEHEFVNSEFRIPNRIVGSGDFGLGALNLFGIWNPEF
ncbi:MAG: hypothetical protein A3H28_05480 [Acidobacteria bacterium RIFCSPLOWO2_02_FULL_61_28]|nr:MAG: hypothetical protein A3H28_05480 [Acidobacteria bacterium RIFCSPLOWO2_02_FULL_61_28]